MRGKSRSIIDYVLIGDNLEQHTIDMHIDDEGALSWPAEADDKLDYNQARLSSK